MTSSPRRVCEPIAEVKQQRHATDETGQEHDVSGLGGCAEHTSPTAADLSRGRARRERDRTEPGAQQRTTRIRVGQLITREDHCAQQRDAQRTVEQHADRDTRPRGYLDFLTLTVHPGRMPDRAPLRGRVRRWVGHMPPHATMVRPESRRDRCRFVFLASRCRREPEHLARHGHPRPRRRTPRTPLALLPQRLRGGLSERRVRFSIRRHELGGVLTARRSARTPGSTATRLVAAHRHPAKHATVARRRIQLVRRRRPSRCGPRRLCLGLAITRGFGR